MSIVIKNNYISIKPQQIVSDEVVNRGSEISVAKLTNAMKIQNNLPDNYTNHYLDEELRQGESVLGIVMLMSSLKSRTYKEVLSVIYKGVPIKWVHDYRGYFIDREQFNFDVYEQLKENGILKKISCLIEKHFIEEVIAAPVLRQKLFKV